MTALVLCRKCGREFDPRVQSAANDVHALCGKAIPEQQLDLFTIPLPPCGRNNCGPCKAIIESSTAGTNLRCLSCNCIAPLMKRDA